MKIKHILTHATVIASALIMSIYSISASANDKENSLKLNGMKIAIIKNAIGSKELIAGNYNEGLTKLSNSSKQNEYEGAMGLCVANLKTHRYIEANIACSQAIDTINNIADDSYHNRYLKSLAYSNRGVVRYLAKDSYGALDDFTTALLVDNNDIVKKNLLNIKTVIFNNKDNTIELAQLR